jgi:glycosyltransferase involved in cell wall biosynthesis
MDGGRRLRVLVVGPALDGTDVGEVYSIAQLVQALTAQADVTILSSQPPGRELPVAEQYPLAAAVVTWPEPAFLRRSFERLEAMAKPSVPLFFAWARAWIARRLAAGERFDIAHQVLPQGMRYASPLRHFAMPYVVGPLGGGLSTPAPFLDEVGRAPLMTRARAVDGWRLRHDPWLRAGYARAGLVLGVAPYVAEALAPVPVRRFEVLLERSHQGRAPEIERQGEAGRLELLHVGRVVRTKGLRDMVRAMAHLADLPRVTLTSVGDGEDLAACRAEAERLGLARRIGFLGQVPRAEVDRLYARADVFAFPSFREPMGGVLFEALHWGLPVITAARGGPDFIVDDSCGIRVPVTDPERYPRDIAQAVRRLAGDPALRASLGAGARDRIAGFGTWEETASRLIGLYRQTIAAQSGRGFAQEEPQEPRDRRAGDRLEREAVAMDGEQVARRAARPAGRASR